MGIFNLINVKTPEKRESGFVGKTSGSLTENSEYSKDTYRYPLDLGSTDKGHYMVIHVNAQERTDSNYTPNWASSDESPTIIRNSNLPGKKGVFKSASNFLNNEQVSDSTISKIASIGADAFTDLGGDFGKVATKTLTENFKMLKSGKGARTIRRTTDTIALYMPDTLAFTQNQSYSATNLGGGFLATAGALADAGESIIEKYQQSDSLVKALGSIGGQNLSPFVGSFLSDLAGDQGRAVFAAATGTVVNPQLEVIYSAPDLRTFRFEFMFYPRSTKEAVEVQQIIQRLRFHQAPEILTSGAGALGGFFLVPPSEFDIEFYYNGKINENIPKISTCVMTILDADYAPNGFSAYETDTGLTPSMGGTGMPVAIRLSLGFMETEVMTKSNYSKTVGTTFSG